MLQHLRLPIKPMDSKENMEETTDLEAVEDVVTNVEETDEGVTEDVHQET